MDPLNPREVYPFRSSELFYRLQNQTPSYQSEFPHDIPYDPGATSSLFELNYLPTGGASIIAILFIVCASLIGLYFLFRKNNSFISFLSVGFMVAILLTFFGPLRLPSIMHFRTLLGFVKLIGLVLFVLSLLLPFVHNKYISFFRSYSFYPVTFFVISQLLSVFTLTNVSYFLTDFGILATGLFFYYLGFVYFDRDVSVRMFRALFFCMLLACLPVFAVFLFRESGISFISSMYPKYENFVFLHDLSRGRIFSIIDFEYFVPCIVFWLVYTNKRKRVYGHVIAAVATAITLAAIVLVNYRYRFLTYLMGFVLMYNYMKPYRQKIRTIVLTTLGVIFACYLVISIASSKSTIIDRFLMKNYAEDVTSVDRRFVMYRQALDLFMQSPILGVGTGNYKDNVQIVYSLFGGRTYEPYYKILQNVYAYPHNWYLTLLAENGLIGITIFSWMVYSFVTVDIRLWKSLTGNSLLIFSTTSSVTWLFMFANLFTHMHVSLPMVIIFWAFRGMIEKMYALKFISKNFVS